MKKSIVAAVVSVFALLLVFFASSGERWRAGGDERKSFDATDATKGESRDARPPPSDLAANSDGVSSPISDFHGSGTRGSEFRASPATFSERLRELEIAARVDPNALADLSSFRGTCQYWQQNLRSQDESAQSKREEWGALESVCSESAIARFEEALNAASGEAMHEVMLQPWHHNAATAEEFAKRDARLQEQMRRASSAAAAFNAAIVYFDHERFSQWAGPSLPRYMLDESGYRRSRIGLDVAWMYACRLGFDCGLYAGTTLLECWETPTCVPGGAARQVVQMRRSPLELRLVDSMVDRLMAERVAVQR